MFLFVRLEENETVLYKLFFLPYVFSQDHKMEGSSEDLLEQVCPDQAAQECVQACLESLQRRKLHNLSGQPGAPSPSQERSFSLCLGGTSCVVVCAPLPLVSLLDTTE